MIYEYECGKCGEVTDHSIPLAEHTQEPRDCPECGAEKAATFILSVPNHASVERKRGDKRVIVDERQVIDEHGPNWRDKGTTGKPGGAGKRIYFH